MDGVAGNMVGPVDRWEYSQKKRAFYSFINTGRCVFLLLLLLILLNLRRMKGVLLLSLLLLLLTLLLLLWS